MPSSRFLISSQTLTSTAASVTFSSIPSGYADLVVKMSMRLSNVSNQEYVQFRLNGNSSSLYSDTWIRGDGASASSSRDQDTYGWLEQTPGANATANTFGSTEMYIPSYLASQSKPLSVFNVAENNSSTAYMAPIASLFRSSTAITSISFHPGSSGNFVTGSSFYLYGLKAS
jgi:hypothetical protein